MPAGSRRVVRAAAAVLLIALAAPAAAFAGGGGTCSASACKVYHESGPPNSGQHHTTTTPTTTPTTGSNNDGGGAQPTVLRNKSRVLAQAGKDKGPLKNLLADDSAIGSLPHGSGGGSPGLLGAAFDLGVGPTVLLVILLATALGLATRGSLPRWLRKRSRS